MTGYDTYKPLIDKNAQLPTSYIKHLAVSGLSNVSARIKSRCNLTSKCFEMPNVSYTYPLCATQLNHLISK